MFEKKCGGGTSINIPWKIYQGRQIKGIVRVLNWLKSLGGIMYFKSTAGCQLSTLIFENKLWRVGSLWISHEKYIKHGKVLAHLGLRLKVLSGSLTDVSAYVGSCTSSPQQGVKYQLWYLKTNCGGLDLYKYPMKNISRTAKFLPTWGLD